MIPVIGVMIGLYILTRMAELLGSGAKPFIKVFAAITALGSVIGIAALVESGNILPALSHTPTSSAVELPSLSAPNPALNLTPPVGTPDAGWILSESKDPLDDSPKVVLTVSASSGRTRFGEAPNLVLRCSRKKTEAYINWNDFMGTDAADVSLRVGHAPLSEMSWSLSTDNKATFYPASAVSFIKSLLDSDTLVARATPYEESPITAVFAVAGLSSKITSLETACGWH